MGLNINTGSQPTPDFSGVQGAAPTGPATSTAPATTLGPVDTTTTAQGTEIPNAAYTASSGTPTLPAPVTMPQATVRTTSSTSTTASTSTNEGGDSVAAGTQATASQIAAPTGGDALPVTVDVPRQQQQGDDSSGGGQGDNQGDGSGGNQSSSGIGSAPVVPGTTTTTISDVPDQSWVDNLNGLLTDTNAQLDGLNAIDPTTYVDNPSDFNGVMGNILTQGQETIDSMLANLNNMPDSPEKLKMIDFLSAVSKAITELQDMIREIQGFDAEAARGRSQAQLDTSLANVQQQLDAIREQGENLAEQQKKEKALEKVGLTTQALNIIIMVVMVIIAIPAIIAAGPIGGSIIAAMIIVILVDMIMKASGDEQGVFTRMMDGVGDLTKMAMESAGGYTQDQIDAACLGVKMAVTAIIVAALIWASPSCALLVCSAGISSMISACEIGSEIARLSGADESTQMWCELGVEMAAMVVMAVASFGTSGLGAANQVATTSNKVAALALKTSEKLGSRGAQIAFEATTAASSVALETGNSVVNYQLMQLRSDLVDIQAGTDSEAAIKEALIKVLKDIIKKLQESISGMNDFLSSLNTMQSTNYQNLSANLPM